MTSLKRKKPTRGQGVTQSRRIAGKSTPGVFNTKNPVKGGLEKKPKFTQKIGSALSTTKGNQGAGKVTAKAIAVAKPAKAINPASVQKAKPAPGLNQVPAIEPVKKPLYR